MGNAEVRPKRLLSLYGDWVIKYDCPIFFITSKAKRNKPRGAGQGPVMPLC